MFDISELFLFKGLAQKERDRIIALLPEPTEYSKGEYIFSAREFVPALGVLISGEAKITVPEDSGSRVVMKRLFSGDIFGAVALFAKDEYVTDILAVKPCKVILIPRELLFEIFKEYPAVSMNYIEGLTLRIRFLNQKVKALSGRDAVSKLREYFEENAGNDGKAALPKNMNELSKVLGIGRSSLYRALETLEKQKVIFRKEDGIYLTGE